MARLSRRLENRTRDQEVSRVWKFYDELHTSQKNSNLAKAFLFYGAPILGLMGLALYMFR